MSFDDRILLNFFHKNFDTSSVSPGELEDISKKEIQKRIEAEMSNTHILWELKKARKLVKTHKNIIICAGSGMSQESGIPTWRESEGKKFLSREEFKEIIPHEGYQLLLNYCKNKEYFILTSNIDCLFQKTGFDENRIIETYGKYHNQHWGPKDIKPEEEQLDKWFEEKLEDKILIIEIGCGMYFRTIRNYSESLLEKYPESMSLIRINPEYPSIPKKFLKFRQGNRISTARLEERCILALQSILP